MKYTINKVCCEPFADKSAKIETVGEGQFKVAKVANTKATLTKLAVLNEAKWLVAGQAVIIPAGSSVWVRASDYANPWGKEVLSLEDGTPCILVPCERIELIEDPFSMGLRIPIPWPPNNVYGDISK